MHIGQYAAGQRFLFRAHPGQGLTTLADWLAFIDRPGMALRAEHGLTVSVQEVQQTMTAATDDQGLSLRARFRGSDEDRYVTSGGHAFSRRALC
ncbi:hypothetical protein GL259_00380 [Streptomyces sp. Tu 3180]|nr:hypothetical protein GL259_00380 [Streptomyces sp. Tu 3180]